MRALPAPLVVALGCSTFAPEAALRARPYVWASAGQLELRSCRFRTGTPLGVTLARDASPAEARLWRGVTRPLGEAELTGVLLHELAHALGGALPRAGRGGPRGVGASARSAELGA